MRLRIIVLALLAAGCTGSERAPARAAARPHYLADVPVVPHSQVLDTTGTPDLEHAVLRAPAPLDSVIRFYRQILPARGWHIEGDTGDSAGALLYATREGRPLWIQIRRTGALSEVSLSAAGASKADTAAPARP